MQSQQLLTIVFDFFLRSLVMLCVGEADENRNHVFSIIYYKLQHLNHQSRYATWLLAWCSGSVLHHMNKVTVH